MSNCDGVGAAGLPVKVGEASGAFADRALVTVVAKFGSLPRATASSLRVSKAPGDEATSAAIAACTKAVFASWVVLVPATAVGAAGIPVNTGEARGARVVSVGWR
ncbi:hypothetical protein D3C84_1027450 [compost metagenome]